MRGVRLRNVRRILVLNRNHIGDCLLTTPLLRALKRRFPRARLTVSVPAANQELLAGNPHVDEILPRPQIKSWGAKFRFAFEMRRRGYDLIVSPQEKSVFYAWAAYYAAFLNPSGPLTVGLDHPRTRRWYQYNVPVRADQHEVYKYLDIAAFLGCPPERSPALELVPGAAARERLQQALCSQGVDPDTRFIGLNPGGTSEEKRWPVERFAAVGDRLHAELGLPVMVCGGPGDHGRAAAIVERMESHDPVVAAGRTSLGETAALLERCELLITGDTGPMHMAVALAVPVVALFGPTDPAKFRPFTSLSAVLRHGAPCGDCRARRAARSGARRTKVRDEARNPSPDAPCLHTISAEECVEAALRLYQAPPSRVRSDLR